MEIGEFLEKNDIDTLSIIDTSGLPKLDRLIVKHCVEENKCYAHDIFIALGSEAAIRFMQLCNEWAKKHYKTGS